MLLGRDEEPGEEEVRKEITLGITRGRASLLSLKVEGRRPQTYSASYPKEPRFPQFRPVRPAPFLWPPFVPPRNPLEIHQLITGSRQAKGRGCLLVIWMQRVRSRLSGGV